MFITPGTPRIVIISYSMNYGVRNCIWTALGDVTANIIQACLVIFVIGSFISDNPTLLNIFKWFGVIFKIMIAAVDTPLLYLFVYFFRKKFNLQIGEEINEVS